MRLKLSAGLTTFILYAAVAPWQSASGQKLQADPANDPLRLAVRVVSQSYCIEEDDRSGGPPIGHLEILLHLKIKNASRHRVILCPTCIEPDDPRTFALNSDGTPGNLVYNMNTDRFGYEPSIGYPDRPNDRYQILGPGETLETQKGVWLLGVLDSAYPARYGGMSNGKYLLEAHFLMWRWEKPEETERIKQKWAKYGQVYDGDLKASPIPIEIEFPAKPPTCRH